MSDQTSEPPTRNWMFATFLLALLLVVAAAGAGIEHQRANEAAAALETSVQQLEATQARLEEVQTQLADVSKPDLPVTVSFRNALSGSGLVGVFKNNSLSPLEIAAVFSSPTTGGKRAANLVIPANGVKEIGHVEGWPFAAGQHIHLVNDRYRAVEYDIPGT
jgi:hypothetical protein